MLSITNYNLPVYTEYSKYHTCELRAHMYSEVFIYDLSILDLDHKTNDQ
jgi:hypothetical protein